MPLLDCESTYAFGIFKISGIIIHVCYFTKNVIYGVDLVEYWRCVKMVAKILFRGKAPKTQSISAVRELIAFQQHGQKPEKMPEFYRLSESMVLVRSNKGDAYYTTMPDDCSCPAMSFNPEKLCKHSRMYFPQLKKEALSLDSIRPVGDWIGPDGKRANGPIDSLPALKHDDLHYSDKAMLPMHTKWWL